MATSIIEPAIPEGMRLKDENVKILKDFIRNRYFDKSQSTTPESNHDLYNDFDCISSLVRAVLQRTRLLLTANMDQPMNLSWGATVLDVAQKLIYIEGHLLTEQKSSTQCR